MVERETVELEHKAAVKMLSAALQGASFERAINGNWTLVLDLNGGHDLGDGRTLRVENVLRVRAWQKGRKR